MKKPLIIAFTILFCANLFTTTAFVSNRQTRNLTAASKAYKIRQASSELGYNVRLSGAKGDGKTDDTAAIQKALNKYDSVYIPDGTYKINVEKSLSLKSGQKLIMANAAVLQAIPTNKENSAVIKIASVSNVVLAGGKVIGERYTHLGTSGEWGMGIIVESGATNISINDISISDCWGDGIYIGKGTTPNSNITVNNVISDNNRRQGISITNATHVTISNSIFKNTNGVAPSAGIDIEPNAGQITSDITITGTQSYNNAGSGIDLMGLNVKLQRIHVTGSVFRDNATYGVRIENASDVMFADSISTNNYYGVEIPRDAANVKFVNMTINNNKRQGVAIISTKQKEGIKDITFESSNIFNNSQSKINNVDGVRIDNYDKSGYISNVSFNNCKFYDSQTVKTQRYGMTVAFSGNMSSITVNKGCEFNGNISGNLLGGRALSFGM